MSTSSTTMPTIPDVPTSLAQDVQDFLSAIKEALEIGIGNAGRGTLYDQFATVRQLVNAGLEAKSLEDNSDFTYDFSNVVTFLNSSSIEPPSNFVVTNQVFANKLTWTNPDDNRFDHVEVWVSIGSNNRANAFCCGLVSGVKAQTSQFVHSGISTSQNYYYWVRSVDTNYNAGKFNPTSALAGEEIIGSTRATINELLDDLTDETNYVNAYKVYADAFMVIQPLDSYTQWTTGTVYVADDVRKHDGSGTMKAYFCILGHTSGSTSEPGIGATWETYWSEIDADLVSGLNVFTVGLIDGNPSVGIRGDLIIDGGIMARMIQAEAVEASHMKADDIFSLKITIGEGSSGVANLSDAGALALQDTADWITDIINKPAALYQIYYQSSAPESGMSTGDYWIDTDDNQLYRYDGDSWESVQDADISDALSQIGDAQAELDNIADDEKLTPVEKLSVKPLWDTIVAEATLVTGTLVVQAAAYSVNDSDFDSAYAALYNLIVTTLNVFDDMEATTTITRATWDTVWKNYYIERTNLLNDIADAIQSAADDAQDAADDAQDDATTALGELDDLAADTKITPVEKLTLKPMWDTVVAEATLVTGTLVVQAAAYSVNDSSFDTAYSNLYGYLITTLDVFGNMTTTTTINRNTWDTYWKAYWAERTDLLNDIADAIQSAADDAQSTADSKILVFSQAGEPTAEDVGDLWIDTDDNNKPYRWSGDEWVAVQYDVADWDKIFGDNKPDDNATQNTIYRQAEEPEGQPGDIWYDTDNKLLYRYDSEWELVGNAYSLTSELSDDAALGETAIWSSITGIPSRLYQIFYQSSEPGTGMSTGDYWMDTDDNQLYRYDGDSWESVQDAAIQDAIDAAGDAQSTADGKVYVFAQSSVPTSVSIGDLWIDTDDNNKIYRAASVGANEIKAGEWVAYRDGTIAIAQTAAEAAQSAADDAQDDADTANGLLDDIAADTKITPVEKLTLKPLWDSIVVEGTATTGTIPVQATAFGVDDSDFDTAYANLYGYLITTLDVFDNMTTTTTINRSTWDTYWEAYYDERTQLLNDIADAAATMAVWSEIIGSDKPEDNATSSTLYRQASAPSTPTTNDLWYDTDDDILYRYSGADWEVMASNDASWRHSSDQTLIDGGKIYTNTITADKFISTLYGDLNQAMNYVKTVLGAGDEYQHDLTAANLAAGSDSDVDADEHSDYDISIRLATSVLWDDGGAVWDTGTWDAPTESSGSWTSAAMDIGSLSNLQIALRFTLVEDNSSSTSVVIKAQYSTDNVDFGINDDLDDGNWETLTQKNLTGDIYHASGKLYEFRYFKLKIELATSDTDDRIILHTMTYLGNVITVFGQFVNQTIAAGGTSFDLSGFNATPAITVTPVGSTPLVPLITSQSDSSVTIKLYNLSGTDVGGNANITIIGV